MPEESWSLLLTEWDWEPSIVLGSALLSGAYLYAIGPLRRRLRPSGAIGRGQVAFFLLGVAVMFLALVSPLDKVGDEYLFSAHMAQHLLLIMVMPPLLLMGMPGWLLRSLVQRPSVAGLARLATSPVVAFVLFNGNLWLWHLPAPYDLALRYEGIHIVEHLSFMATAVINWWPVLGPLLEVPRLSHPGRMAYLFLNSLASAALGILLVFARDPLYPSYVEAPRVFGISALADQQLGGLIMWVPGGLVYLLAISIVFFTWFSRQEGETTTGPRASS